MNTSYEGARGSTEGPQAAAAQPAPPPPGGPLPGAAPPPWTGRWGRDPRCKSPLVAGLLAGFVPGLGQVYLGYYQRGFLHALIFGGTIACLASGVARGMEPLFGIFIAFFYCFMIVDAVRRASLCNQALAGMGPVALPEDFKMPGGRPSLFGGLVVTGIGFILLLNSRFDFDLDWLVDWWPAVIVVIGVHMLWKSWRSSSRS